MHQITFSVQISKRLKLKIALNVIFLVLAWWKNGFSYGIIECSIFG